MVQFIHCANENRLNKTNGLMKPTPITFFGDLKCRILLRLRWNNKNGCLFWFCFFVFCKFVPRLFHSTQRENSFFSMQLIRGQIIFSFFCVVKYVHVHDGQGCCTCTSTFHHFYAHNVIYTVENYLLKIVQCWMFFLGCSIDIV